MTLPLVSIVTPSYNQAEYLDDTIRSVLNQDYPNLEYLIVDGGSTDGSLEIIQQYADRLAWWVSEPDQGQAEAINKGLRQARGEVVAWLNSDDFYLPGAIRAAMDVLDADPDLSMVFGDAVTIDPQGKPLNKLTFGDWSLPELMRFRMICQPAVFMRRAVYEQAGYLDESFDFMLDHHLWLRIANKGRIRYLPKIWAAARHHPDAKNVAQATAFAAETYRLLVWMETNLEFAARFAGDRRRILGGAHRLAGRYLLDGGSFEAALQAYGRALFYWPGYALKHWHRITFVFASLLGLGEFARRFSHLTHRESPVMDAARLQNWPGIHLQDGG